MIQHTFNAVQVRVDPLPDGDRQLAILHPDSDSDSGEVWLLLRLDAAAAKALGHTLITGVDCLTSHDPTNGKTTRRHWPGAGCREGRHP